MMKKNGNNAMKWKSNQYTPSMGKYIFHIIAIRIDRRIDLVFFHVISDRGRAVKARSVS
jgi:hypothetical protein